MRFDVLTLFPEMFTGYLGQSLLKLAIAAGLVEAHLHDIRGWADNKHKKVDDRPFGGGPGMVLMVDPVVRAVEAVRPLHPDPGHLVMLTPQGRRLDQAVVEELAGNRRILLVCGRYEGFDERIRLILRPDEISIGDYVLNGGEVAAMAIIDAVIRLVPGVLGDAESSGNDSFSGPRRWLEFAQYTRPRAYRGLEVPPVLVGGNHDQIDRWRRENSRERTQQRRGDLIGGPTHEPTEPPPATPVGRARHEREDHEPSGNRPAGTGPAGSDPGSTEPAETEPAKTEPAGMGPAGGEAEPEGRRP
jgi:tRNA (guanine37-N1)-methyltransferase